MTSQCKHSSDIRFQGDTWRLVTATVRFVNADQINPLVVNHRDKPVMDPRIEDVRPLDGPKPAEWSS